MDIQEYIASGNLEAYVLGSLSESEQARVAADIAAHPELAAEVAAIEEAMWRMAEAGAETPPPMMKDTIWAQVNLANETVQPAPRTIPLNAERSYNLRWQRAAVLLALVGSMLVNFILWSQRNNTREAQVAIKSQLDTMQQQLAMLRTNAKKQGEMLADSNMRAVVMQSMKPGHPMAATVYWNKANGTAYLAMQNLPMPDKDKQYQMWVIQNGKPVSMGVLDSHMLDTPTIAKLPMEVKDGQAFAISLEKQGGNPTPTEVYVLGKIS